MTLAEEIDALLQQAVNTSRTMHRLEGGEASPGATEREMIELLISMSNATSKAVRTLAEQVDALRAAIDARPQR
jgi:hypothetical protein